MALAKAAMMTILQSPALTQDQEETSLSSPVKTALSMKRWPFDQQPGATAAWAPDGTNTDELLQPEELQVDQHSSSSSGSVWESTFCRARILFIDTPND